MITSDRLSPLDVAFLAAEDADRNTSMAIASAAVLTGPPPSQDAFASFISDRLPALPRWRQVVRTVPLDLGRPFWIDVPDVDLDFHLHRAALPAPGDDAALTALIGRVMSQKMDRDRPLWEIWVVEGLADDRWAIVSKVHHCMTDGVGGTMLYEIICNGDGRGGRTTDAAEPPGTVNLLRRVLSELAAIPAQQIRLAGRALRQPLKFGAQAAKTVQGLLAYGLALLPAASTSLTGRIGRHRRYGVARASLKEVIEAGHAFRVTANEILLAAISGAYRDLLLARGERPVADSVRSLVPVNVRDGDSSDLHNQISAMLPVLPVDIEDPVERLRVVHERLADLKAGAETSAGSTVVSLAGQEVFAPIAWAIRLALHIPQRGVVTVTTNVPGPRHPLSLLGREIVEILPYVPIGVGVRTGVAIMSYQDKLALGVTADFDSSPEVDLLVSAVEGGIGDLVAAARRHAPK